MEFQEVMRQWQRMCKSMQEENMSCKEDCPLGHNPTCGELEYASLEEINNTETVIMAWAAEHPGSKYPTWEEWLIKSGILLRGNCGTWQSLTTKATDPIPADIAQKLGLEPEENKDE